MKRMIIALTTSKLRQAFSNWRAQNYHNAKGGMIEKKHALHKQRHRHERHIQQLTDEKFRKGTLCLEKRKKAHVLNAWFYAARFDAACRKKA